MHPMLCDIVFMESLGVSAKVLKCSDGRIPDFWLNREHSITLPGNCSAAKHNGLRRCACATRLRANATRSSCPLPSLADCTLCCDAHNDVCAQVAAHLPLTPEDELLSALHLRSFCVAVTCCCCCWVLSVC